LISLRSIVRHIGQSFVQADGLPFFPLNMRFCSYLGKGNPKNFGDMVKDSAIVAVCAIFGVLAGFGPPTRETAWPMVWAVFVAFGSAFFTQLAFEKRIKVPK